MSANDTVAVVPETPVPEWLDWTPRCDVRSVWKFFGWRLLPSECEQQAGWLAGLPCDHASYVCNEHRASWPRTMECGDCRRRVPSPSCCDWLRL